MTALLEFERLESTGLWYAAPGAQRQDVILSLGEASLTVYDHRETPLAHWSLAALYRVNPGRRPAIYAPGPDAPERLEIEDDTMVKAVERVRRAVERGRPHPGRLRLRLVLAAAFALLLFVLFWLPGALVRYTAAIVPEGGRAAISADLLDRVQRVAGRPCETTPGRDALSALVQRLAPEGPGRLVVLAGGLSETAHLPDGTVLINRAIVEDHETPEIAAGFILAEAERIGKRDPFLEFLEQAGLGATLRLMTSGRMAAETLDAHAEALLTADPAPVPAGRLLPRFGRAGVSATPYAYALDITGESSKALIEGDPARGTPRPVLNDDDWVALQGICGG